MKILIILISVLLTKVVMAETVEERLDKLQKRVMVLEQKLSSTNSVPKATGLKVKDMKPLITKRCPILNIKYELNKKDLTWGSKKGQNNWANSMSVDRIDNSRGYISGNVVLVSSLANAIKNQATPDQILKVGNFYKKLYDEKGINYDK